ncbi:CRISPR-associated endonuclease Cas1 [uncultured Methanobrevibacter sp.]|uniref:CRISPR-associated endonuclease Cas1 n=1 Tax=uncultured Methanobrevibacter sp. TaxID=253161 RepID=UPI003422E2A4
MIIKEKDNILDSINANKISSILIIGKGYITFDALTLISKNNIKLISFDYFGRLNYILESPDRRNVKLKKYQYQLSENSKGIRIAKELIKSKMLNQKSTLTTLNKRKKIDEINVLKNKITKEIKEIDSLKLTNNHENIKMKIMGCEGKASYEYWSGIKLLIPPNIGFEQRIQKPTDLLNSMLNYGYAILASEITKSILLNGLDPYCGFLHFDRDNRTSLTYDLIEDFRQQIVDKTVINLINKKQITVTDLDKRNNSIKLDKRKVIVSKIMDKINSTINYNGEELTYKDIMNKQTSNLVKTILDEEEFRGFSLHWWVQVDKIQSKKFCPKI